MYTKKRWFSASLCMLLVFCICSSISFTTNASGTQSYADGYNDSLGLVGLTHERYLTMNPSTQSIYSGMNLESVNSTSRYYRVTESTGGASKNTAVQTRSGDPVIEEISAEQYEFETLHYLSNFSYYHMLETLASSEKKQTTSWITMTTRLAESSTDRWALSNDVTSLDPSGGATWDATDVIALGIGSQCSVIENSEYLHLYRKFWKPTEDHVDVRDDYPDVQVQAANGYAAYYYVEQYEQDHTVYFIVALTTHDSGTTMVDGYGYYARKEAEVVPDISFGTGGGSLSISPSSSWKRISAGHVQLEVN